MTSTCIKCRSGTGVLYSKEIFCRGRVLYTKQLGRVIPRIISCLPVPEKVLWPTKGPSCAYRGCFFLVHRRHRFILSYSCAFNHLFSKFGKLFALVSIIYSYVRPCLYFIYIYIYSPSSLLYNLIFDLPLITSSYSTKILQLLIFSYT